MENKEIIMRTQEYVKQELSGAEGGHDWWHIERVYNLARKIGEDEGADMHVVELGALLHDIADWKFTGGDESIGPNKARKFLTSQNVSEQIIDQVCDIILNISYKGAIAENKISTLEGKCVQDADRLDALGAIGIARCMCYTGHSNRPIHNPNIPVHKNQSAEQYKNSKGSAINHFYEKLLLLKDRMNTETGKELAQKRHEFMENYLSQFYEEWAGKI